MSVAPAPPLSAEDEATLQQIESGDQPHSIGGDRQVTDDEETAQPPVQQTQQEHGRGFRERQDPKSSFSSSFEDGVENNRPDHESMCNGCLLVCEDFSLFLLPMNIAETLSCIDVLYLR